MNKLMLNRPLNHILRIIIASSAILCATTPLVRADLLVYEGFNYAVTADAGSGTELTNGFGWAQGSYWPRENSKDTLSITESSLTYGNVVTTSNKFEHGGSLGRYSNRSFSDMIDSSVSEVIWGGVVMKTPPSSKTGRTSRFKLRNGGTTQFYVNADSTLNIVVGGGSATEIDTGIPSGGSTRLYLYKIDLSGAEPVAEIWINPPDFSSEATLGTPSATLTNVGGIFNGFSLGAGGGNPAQYDEIRIGTTLEDAWKTLPPVVPLGTVLMVR